MKAISYTNFRGNLAKQMEEVCDNHEELIVTRQNAQSVVVISLEDYEAIKETLYLLKSPANAKALFESIEQAEKGDFVEMELFEDYEN